ncbi:MAG: isochorismatase family protein [Candidatus Nanopelagicales bacterium]
MDDSTRRALIIVDVQRDFCEGGALPVEGGFQVAEQIADYARAHRNDFDLVITTRDWHRGDNDNSGHFAVPGTQPDYRTTWPVHCVQGTDGARYAPALEAIADIVDDEILMGQGSPGYSGFSGRSPTGATLDQVLVAAGIAAVEVVGLATDFCVCATAVDAARHGYAAAVPLDLCRSVSADDTPAAIRRMRDAGVVVRPS